MKAYTYINKGEFVSIVGGNGSGKSILMDILAGFREYNGNIFINGIYLYETWWRFG